MKTIFALLSIVAASTAIAAPQTSTGMPANHPSPDMNAASSIASNKGKVVDVIDTAMYTYVQVEADGKKSWIAATRFKVAKGDNINYSNGPVMQNFHSKTLNRDFPEITFVDKAELAKK